MKTLVSAHAKKILAAVAFVIAAVNPVWAATQTVTLSVPDMSCPACPITVKKSLIKVEGVNKVEVKFEERIAIVAFDDAKTNIAKLTAATESAGYPSSVKQ